MKWCSKFMSRGSKVPAREGSGVHKPLSMYYGFQLACLSYLSQGWRCVRRADVHDGGHQQSWNHLERWAERMAHVCENSPIVQISAHRTQKYTKNRGPEPRVAIRK